ncbi:MAG: lytic murein transglycosylase [Pseudomonadota bacterium]
MFRAISALALLLAAGQAAAQAPATPPERPGAAPPGMEAPTPRPGSPAEFRAWIRDFRDTALDAGIRPDVFDAAFEDVSLNARVLELDAYQPEFVRPIWEYLDNAVSETRVATGREKLAEKRELLARIEARHGVDGEIVLAIWGLESAFGVNYGDIPVVESLATLAFDGGRGDFAEEQLLAALRILQAGDVSPSRMVGSWAGAMGHTQFIPTSFEAYAVDFQGDGRRDLWSADAADALASTANYLSRFGWELDAPWGLEARLPEGFDYRLADQAVRRSAARWNELGVRGMDGAPLPAGEGVSVITPAGAQGPAFAVYPNFRVIKRYNNATSYALAAGLLADRIAGGAGVQAGWPRDDRPLSLSEREEMQRRLTALGFDTQGVDGIIGPDSRAAIRDFQSTQGMTPDGYASASLLRALRRAAGG